MPIAAVDEYQLTRLNEDQIRYSRNISAVKSVSEAHCVDKATNGQFRSRVLPSHAAHNFAATLSANGIQMPASIRSIPDRMRSLNLRTLV